MMSSERCAQLATIALANKQSVSWTVRQPMLTITWLAKYLPGLVRILLAKTMNEKELRRLEKLQI